MQLQQTGSGGEGSLVHHFDVTEMENAGHCCKEGLSVEACSSLVQNRSSVAAKSARPLINAQSKMAQWPASACVVFAAGASYTTQCAGPCSGRFVKIKKAQF